MKKLRYSVEIEEDENGSEKYYIARHPEIDGLIGTGSTIDEARKDLFLARKGLIKVLIRDKIKFPKPTLVRN